MKLIGRLSRRVVVTSVLTGIIGAGLTLLLARSVVTSAVSDMLREACDAPALARCEAAPESWFLRGPGDSAVFAYDTSTLRSRNPEAPPLDASLASDVLAGNVDHTTVAGVGGLVVFRGNPSGPCGLLVGRWSGRYNAKSAPRLIASAGLITAIAGALMGLLLVVWPLARRTRALALAAGELGATHGLAPKEDESADELDTALERLRLADERIRHDAKTLAEQSTALERHLGDVAHDVRTPLAALQLTLEQLSDDATDPATRERLASALTECVAISNLTENLRLQSLMDDGLKPSGTQISDLARVLERAVFRAQSLGRRKGITVEMAAPDEKISATGDEGFLERCLTNLLDNAVRFGDREGHVAVVLARHGGEFRLTVRDDGPGVSPDELPKLGQRTYRTDAARRREPRGSGLGLSITRSLCERCGWRLTFAALEPRGLEAMICGSTLSPRTDETLKP